MTVDFPNGDTSKEYFKCHSGELYYVFGNILREGLPFGMTLTYLLNSMCLILGPAFHGL